MAQWRPGRLKCSSIASYVALNALMGAVASLSASETPAGSDALARALLNAGFSFADDSEPTNNTANWTSATDTLSTTASTTDISRTATGTPTATNSYTSTAATTTTKSHSSTATTQTNTYTGTSATTSTNTYTFTATSTWVSATRTSATSSSTTSVTQSSSTRSQTKTTASSTSTSATATTFTSTSSSATTSTSATTSLTTHTRTSSTRSSYTETMTTTTLSVTSTETTSISTTSTSSISSSSSTSISNTSSYTTRTTTATTFTTNTSTRSSSTTEYTLTTTTSTSSTTYTTTNSVTTTATTTSMSSTLTTSVTSTSTRWPEVRVVGSIELIVMNAYSLIRDEFSVVAFRYAIGLLAQVDMASVNVIIEAVQGTSTQALINFVVEEFRLSHQETAIESRRLLAIFDSMPNSLIVAKLRDGLRVHAVDRPLQVIAMKATVSLINPGEAEQVVQLGTSTTTPPDSEFQVGEDSGSGMGVFIALGSVFVSNSLCWA
eukprot:TRINITY_DN14251_c0_g1_i1.p1 TRINITY_DN14251_c0_g1~~TRINITY_DN14251_c0_g1_i1.p1  ORF type:complete len:493 (+),score=38.79 TRINITY_DN14251_c0_g1_i1:55-1533(+)